MAIGVNWGEVWGPVWKAVWTTVAPVAPADTDRRGGAYKYGSRFVQARKRLALQRALAYVTQEDPPAETKRIIRAVKAGKPIEPDPQAPVVMREVSAERLAATIIPHRVEALQAAGVDIQAVILKALAIAREREEEEELLLLL